MTYGDNSLIIEPFNSDSSAINFCNNFLNNPSLRFVFGCNSWASSIAEEIDIHAFVDDYYKNQFFAGKPVIRSKDLPKNALVISAIVGERPLTALARLKSLGISCLDYFAFHKYSGFALKDVLYINEFKNEFNLNRVKYEWLYKRLEDIESKTILSKLINFRLSHQLKFMHGFVNAQDRQYFESFLNLRKDGESFLDIGCYDGFTSLEFIKRCPNYNSIHVFEPEIDNMSVVKSRLNKYQNIHFHPFGAFDRSETLSFVSNGSASMLSSDGSSTIEVRRIDDVITTPYTFLKMDIEGGEIAAVKGAADSISNFKPRLAISVYHKVDDLIKIPEQILNYYQDYRIYLRHYTEGVTETVMFFLPKQY